MNEYGMITRKQVNELCISNLFQTLKKFDSDQFPWDLRKYSNYTPILFNGMSYDITLNIDFE